MNMLIQFVEDSIRYSAELAMRTLDYDDEILSRGDSA